MVLFSQFFQYILIMKFDSLILDVEGTIWNTTAVVAEAWNCAIDNKYPQVPHVDAETLKGQFGKTMSVIADNLFSVLNQSEKNELMKECCVQEQKYLLANTKNITYDGVIDTIKLLSEQIPVFIVSNCQKGYIEVVIEKNKINSYITDFECYGNTLKNKDENIRLIVKRNNLKAPVYVGDTQGDYEACKKADVPFIWAAYGFGKPEDENYFAKIESFSELSSVLK